MLGLECDILDRFLGIVGVVGVVHDGLVREHLGMSLLNGLLNVLHGLLGVMASWCREGIVVFWCGGWVILGIGLGISDSRRVLGSGSRSRWLLLVIRGKRLLMVATVLKNKGN